MGHNEDVVSVWGGGCLSHPTSDMGETSWHYISMGSFQPSRRVLKPRGPLRLEADNIYMVGPDHYNIYTSSIVVQGN